MTDLLLPTPRLERWLRNFGARHGAVTLTAGDGTLRGAAEDGSWFAAHLPFDRAYDGPPELSAFTASAAPPDAWGVLLVRKGGFAVARLAAERVVASKVGQRHVQGRTKAGGQSQQRFARRRANQARDAHRAAADHAARVLAGAHLVVTGGDRRAVGEVLADPRLRGLAVSGRWLPVADPRRAVLDAAVADAQALRVQVHNA